MYPCHSFLSFLSTPPWAYPFVAIFLLHPVFFLLLFQGRCSDLCQTAASETGGWREDDRNHKRGSRVRHLPFLHPLFSSPLLSSQLIFLLSIIHPTSFFTGLSPLSQWYWVYLFTELLHSCCSDLYHWFGLFGICRLNGIHDKLYLRLSFYVLLCHKSFFQFTYLLPESLSEDPIRN